MVLGVPQEPQGWGVLDEEEGGKDGHGGMIAVTSCWTVSYNPFFITGNQEEMYWIDITFSRCWQGGWGSCDHIIMELEMDCVG